MTDQSRKTNLTRVGRNKQFDPDEVLDAALDLFWRRGYEATSTADLVTETGIARGSLYATFHSKHELYLRTLDRYVRAHYWTLFTMLRPRYDRSRSGQVRSGQVRSGTDQSGTGQSGTGQSGPGRSGPGQSGPLLPAVRTLVESYAAAAASGCVTW